MNITLQKSVVKHKSSIKITGSKSESNRLLLLQALYPELKIENLSNSDDSHIMNKALVSASNVINVHHAGTAMRFLTAFFSIQEEREIVLTGSSRMQERPIQILVEALQQLGADISYKKNHGYPPIRIKGKRLTKNRVKLKANVSSQYISALLLIASKLKNGLELSLEGEITSVPYINMTLALLNEIDVETIFKNNTIEIRPNLPAGEAGTQDPRPKILIVESDWSSASYYYSVIALSKVGTEVRLSSYKQNSLQGDSALVEIYRDFGVETIFEKHEIKIIKANNCNLKNVNHNLKNAPDIAQTIAVTCLGLGIGCSLTGLHTLKIKETDRLEALKTEIEKCGTPVSITQDSLTILKVEPLQNNIVVDTYNDHRMAMAFAPLALKTTIKINEADVVSKSYPNFWEDFYKIGFSINKC